MSDHPEDDHAPPGWERVPIESLLIAARPLASLLPPSEWRHLDAWRQHSLYSGHILCLAICAHTDHDIYVPVANSHN